MNIDKYKKIRNGEGIGFYKQNRGLLEISGNEAVQFLDGLITNDMKTLESGKQMLAAFPNAKGRLLGIVGILRKGDKFLFETAPETHQKIYENLFRFTYAGDFFIEDLSENYVSFQFFGNLNKMYKQPENNLVINDFYFVQKNEAVKFEQDLSQNEYVEITDDLYETLRIEEGIPKYGVDMDEETVVPEVGLDNLISYNKGCYIGQEVIARIHFRGKVAKELKGLIFEEENPEIQTKDEIKSSDEKNAGFITSFTYSPKLEKTIALAFIRNAFLKEGTELKVGGFTAKVKSLPFIK